MNPRMLRMLSLAILLVTASETLIVHWALVTNRGSGLDLAGALLIAAAFGAVNALLFPVARRRVRAKGLGLVFSRVWILGSVSMLLTGMLLSSVLMLVNLFAWSMGLESDGQAAFIGFGGAAVALGLGSGFWGSTVGSLRVRVDSIPIALKNIPDDHPGFDVVHISDLHIGPLLRPERLGQFIERINGLEPDMIVITGDIFDFDPLYVEAGCRELANLTAKRGVFAVLGNHDHYTGTEEVASGLLAHTSIRLLRDEWEHIDVEGMAFVIAGLEDPLEGWMDKHARSPVLERFAAEIPTHLPSLLLAHRPSFFHHAEELGFPLVLSGHTHGGQVALPFAGNQNMSRMISDFTRGLFHRGETTMYVSRGLGMAGLPLRLNCPREIARIRISG